METESLRHAHQLLKKNKNSQSDFCKGKTDEVIYWSKLNSLYWNYVFFLFYVGKTIKEKLTINAK